MLVLSHIRSFVKVLFLIWYLTKAFEKRVHWVISWKELLMKFVVLSLCQQLSAPVLLLHQMIALISIIFGHWPLIISVHHHQHAGWLLFFFIWLVIYSIDHVDLVIEVSKVLILLSDLLSFIVLRDTSLLGVAHSTSIQGHIVVVLIWFIIIPLRSSVIDWLQPIDLISIVRYLLLQTLYILLPRISYQILYGFVTKLVIWPTVVEVRKRTFRVLIRVVVCHYAIVITVETKIWWQHLIIKITTTEIIPWGVQARK